MLSGLLNRSTGRVLALLRDRCLFLLQSADDRLHQVLELFLSILHLAQVVSVKDRIGDVLTLDHEIAAGMPAPGRDSLTMGLGAWSGANFTPGI